MPSPDAPDAPNAIGLEPAARNDNQPAQTHPHHQSGDDLRAGQGDGGPYDLGQPGEPEPEPLPAEPTSREEVAALWRSCAPDLTDAQIDLLAQYRDLLHERNQRVNLTAVRDFPGIERRLIQESLRLLPALASRVSAGDRVLDIGTGGGLPGMVLAIARPDLSFTLMDATGKKVQFLTDAVAAMGLANVHPLHGRAEEIARNGRYRGQFRVAVARAVSSLPALIELGLPFVALGGYLVLPKGIDLNEELQVAERAGALVGGRVVEASILPEAGSSVETRLVVIEKVAPTPKTYPRRTGLPTHAPLGLAEKPARSRR
ncbi:MAG: 16S rRNA (guanine(527)-N(7))-methyltransferase RsmG [Thermomicrobiales bacterium]